MKQYHTYRVRLYFGIQYSTIYVTAESETVAMAKAKGEHPNAVECFIVKG